MQFQDGTVAMSNPPPALLVNLTPHDIVLHRQNEDRVRFPSKGNVRAIGTPNVANEVASALFGIPIVEPIIYTSLEGMPDDKTLNILVSLVVANFMVKHDYEWLGIVCVPDTGPSSAIRDKVENRIVGVRQFVRKYN